MHKLKGLGVVLAVVGALVALVATVPTAAPSCALSQLKGTYSFNAVGFAPQPPSPVPPYPVNVGGAFPLLAIGSVTFDGAGHNKGFTEENIGGTTEENTPFEGTNTLAVGPNGVGCVGTWTLQDHHTTPPFNTEGPHFFRITLGRATNTFEFVTFGGGPGPAALSGTAVRDY